MAIRYITEQIKIDIFIAKEDIDSTDVVLLYSTDGDDTLIATLRSRETDDDPSILGDSYLFTHQRGIQEPGTYTYRFTTRDSAMNESDTIDALQHTICSTPVTPDPIPFDQLSFGENTSGQVDLTSDSFVQFKMNDALATTNVINEFGDDGTYSGTNTINRTEEGRINEALDFRSLDSNYIDMNDTLQTELRSSFSINMWVKPVTGQPPAVRYFFGASDGGAAVFALTYDSTGIWLTYRAGSTPFITGYIGDNPMVDDQWHMITITIEEVDTNTARGKVYIDDIEIGDSGNVSLDMDAYTNNRNIYIGALNSVGTDQNHHNGLIDDFRFFTKVITTADRHYLWNGGSGLETSENDLSEEFQTVYHYPIDNPSHVSLDGDYEIGETEIGVTDQRPDEYLYFRTYSNTCGSISADSATTSNLNLPTSDVEPLSLFIQTEANGTFSLRWGYSAIASDPITHFNVYYRIIDEDPSVEGWILDGSVNWNAMINNFSFLSTTQFEEGSIVEWKINPVSDGGERSDSGDTIEGTPDFDAPVVINYFTRITLL